MTHILYCSTEKRTFKRSRISRKEQRMNKNELFKQSVYICVYIVMKDTSPNRDRELRIKVTPPMTFGRP